MKISELITKLESAKDHLGDVKVYIGSFLDSQDLETKPQEIDTINYEGDHIELV